MSVATDYAHVTAGDWVFGLSSVLLGCCSNVVFLELLVKEAPDCAQLLTFMQFVFVSLAALKDNLVMLPPRRLPQLKPRAASLRHWLSIVVVFFLVNLLNNLVFRFKISMPFHIIFRSASLLVSMVMGILYLRRSYSLNEWLGVTLVTVGVVIFTVADVKTQQHQAGSPDEAGELWQWVAGVSLLAAALVLSCILGIMQERVYKTYGKVSQEGLFYIHTLSIPGFLFFAPQIASQLAHFSSSPPFELFGVQISLLGVTLSRLWVYLALNIISQYICIRGVYLLTSITTSVTVNLILSIRKFLSLAISLLYFGNPFTNSQLIASALVFAGTLLYSLPKKQPAPAPDEKEKKEK